MRLEAHRAEIAESPRRRRRKPGNGPGVDEPRLAALDVRHLLDAGYVRMPAAHEIPVPGARHGVAVLGIVHYEDFPSPHFQPSIGTVVLQLPIAVARPPRERDRVA